MSGQLDVAFLAKRVPRLKAREERGGRRSAGIDGKVRVSPRPTQGVDGVPKGVSCHDRDDCVDQGLVMSQLKGRARLQARWEAEARGVPKRLQGLCIWSADDLRRVVADRRRVETSQGADDAERGFGFRMGLDRAGDSSRVSVYLLNTLRPQ